MRRDTCINQERIRTSDKREKNVEVRGSDKGKKEPDPNPRSDLGDPALFLVSACLP